MQKAFQLGDCNRSSAASIFLLADAEEKLTFT